MSGRQVVLLPPHGSRVHSARIRIVAVALLLLLITGGFAGYFLPYSRFSLDNVKLNERHNLRNVNHDLLRRYLGLRFAFDTLRTRGAELLALHRQTAAGLPRPRLPQRVTAAGMGMGITQLHETVHAYEQALRGHVARIDSLRDYFERVPVIVPLEGRAVLAAPFGVRVDPFTNKPKAHNGVDFVAPKGTLVLAAAGGTVTEVRNDKYWGQMLRIRHAHGYVTFYAHLGSVKVTRGKTVKRGDVIGTLGASGLTTGPHLHYEVQINGTPVDPLSLLFPAPDGLLFDTVSLHIRG